MAVTGRNILKGWFRRFMKPTEAQFAAWIDSFWHKTEDSIPIDNIQNLSTILGSKIDRKEIENITQNLLLERRIQMRLETSAHDMFFGEEMTIYRAEAINVASMSVTIEGTDTPLEVNADVSLTIPAGVIAVFNVTRQLTDPAAFLYIKARIKPI